MLGVEPRLMSSTWFRFIHFLITNKDANGVKLKKVHFMKKRRSDV